ncbi:MAG TPA: SPOR domain-containing protein [Terriglobia bacterium]|nr:SPOR domain-containing protein [Terriglobia bacterium]HEX5483502.1 SPOR domain-containing protein [Terriglobia bacterium]
MVVRQQNNSKGLSVRQLTAIFFGAVAVCAMFFALGFLVGRNGRAHNAALAAVEQVPPPSEIPPTVNPPAQNSDSNAAGVNPASNDSSSSVTEQDLKPTVPTPSQQARQTAPAPPQKAAAATDSPAAKSAPEHPEESSARAMMVQVAAVHTERDARALVRKLKSRGFHARLLTPHQARAHDHLYRVQVGPFTSRNQALPALHKLSREGFKPFIKE